MKKLYYFLFTFVFIFVSNVNSNQDSISNFRYDETFFADSTSSLTELHKNLNSLLSDKNIQKDKFSVAIYSLTKNHFYYTKNLNTKLTPASVTKLFTTFSAVASLGKDYKIKTQVYIDGHISKDSLIGNLILRGGGDPLLTITDLEYLADKVSEKGIKFITGDVIADGRIFDNNFHRIQYSGDRDIVEPTPPISGLALERNIVTTIVTTGSSAGKVNVYCVPNSDYFVKINNASVSIRQPKKKSKRSKKTSSLYLNDENDYGLRAGDQLITNETSAKSAGIKISTKDAGNRQNIYISGSLPPNRTYSYQHFIANPNLAVGGAFKQRLISGGIKIKGTFRLPDDKEDFDFGSKKLIAEFQRGLFDVINITNKESDNYLAESLFRIVGGSIYAENTSFGTKSVYDSLFSILCPECNSCSLNDGSGLSRRNLVTTESIIEILKSAYHSDFRDEFINSLSIAGKDGTLRKRMRMTPAQENVKAKTGTLRNVSGLAGFVKTLDGEELAFAAIFNGNNVGLYKYIENQIAELLAGYYGNHSIKVSGSN